eukprot:8993388-Pyramimonas_sp.AAC.1
MPSSPTSPLGAGGLRRFLFQPPSFPCSGGLPPPLHAFGRGGARPIAASTMAQDGSKRASESARWPPRWPKIAIDG